MTLTEKFIVDVEAFLLRTGMSATELGKAALNDPNFVPDLRAGRKPGLGLADRLYEFMKEVRT